MSKFRQNLQSCQIVEELSSNDGFVSYRVSCPDHGICRLLLAHPHARLAVKGATGFFERAETLAQLELPGVATIIDAGYYQERVACLLPLCDGVPLYDFVAMPGTVGDVLGLLRAIVENLSVAHAHGVCHGNLTPPLIVVNEDKQPLLCDFALSQLFVLDYISGVDPRYCSPEQVRGEVATPASDIYNLGCILYRLLSGHPPYHGKNNFSIATRHLEGDFPALPEPFLKCADLLSAMVKLIPSQRSTAEEVLSGMTRLLADKEFVQVHCQGPEAESIADFSADSATEAEAGSSTLSSISSKVEALLKEQKFDFSEPEPLASAGKPEVVAAPGRDEHRAKTGEGRRYFILFLVGIIVGMSAFLGYSYYLDARSTVKPAGGGMVLDVNRLDGALKAWQDHDFERAKQDLNVLVGEFPQDPRAYNNLAAVYAARGDLEQARILLERGLATNSEYATLHQNLGAVYAEMARESYGKALQLNASEKKLPIQVFSSQGLLLLKRKDDAATLPSVAVSEDADRILEPSLDAEQQTVSGGAGTDSAAPQIENKPLADVAKDMETASSPDAPSATEQPSASATSEVAEAPVFESYQIQEFLENWAASWAAHNVERYLACYSDRFEPSGGLARSAWEAQRRRRLQAPGAIEISLSEYQIQKEADGEYVVDVLQSYNSQRYSDITRKQFVLVVDGDVLKIIREYALEIVR